MDNKVMNSEYEDHCSFDQSHTFGFRLAMHTNFYFSPSGPNIRLSKMKASALVANSTGLTPDTKTVSGSQNLENDFSA